MPPTGDYAYNQRDFNTSTYLFIIPPFSSIEPFFHPMFTKFIPLMHRPKAHKVAFRRPCPIINEFFKNYFHFFEVYFRSPFGHLPVTFAQTLIVSSPNFSANLEPLRARLRRVLSKIACFSPPTVYSLEDVGSVWLICAYGHDSSYCDPSHAENSVSKPD